MNIIIKHKYFITPIILSFIFGCILGSLNSYYILKEYISFLIGGIISLIIAVLAYIIQHGNMNLTKKKLLIESYQDIYTLEEHIKKYFDPFKNYKDIVFLLNSELKEEINLENVRNNFLNIFKEELPQKQVDKLIFYMHINKYKKLDVFCNSIKFVKDFNEKTNLSKMNNNIKDDYDLELIDKLKIFSSHIDNIDIILNENIICWIK